MKDEVRILTPNLAEVGQMIHSLTTEGYVFTQELHQDGWQYSAVMSKEKPAEEKPKVGSKKKQG